MTGLLNLVSGAVLVSETPGVPGIKADFSQDNGWTYLVKAVLIIVFLLTSVLIAIALMFVLVLSGYYIASSSRTRSFLSH